MSSEIKPVTSQQELDSLLDSFRNAPEVYIDTEADSLHHYFEKVCLLQFTVAGLAQYPNQTVLVDPLAGLQLGGLLEAIQGKTLIFHGADYDLRMLRSSFDFTPARVFDTMLAARLAGHSALGLEALVLKYTGNKLDHGAQKADWSARPLSNRLLQYAVEDTAYLPTIAAQLRQELETLGRLGWHEQQCQQLIEICSTPMVRNTEDAWRIKGSFELDRESLAILRELWTWRDLEAREWDRPSFMVCNNEALLSFTRWARTNRQANIRQSGILPKYWRGRRAESFIEAMKRSWLIPESQYPEPAPRGKRPEFDPAFVKRLSRLKQIRADLSSQLQLDPSIVAPNALLEAISAANPATPEELKSIRRILPWQIELLAPRYFSES
jgi:ribonuclease D